MSWWEVIDTSDWPGQGLFEQRGRREKQWVADLNGQLWLRKTPRVRGPTEPAVEAFTLELARRCDFGVAHGRAAIWSTASGPRRGFVSKRFHDSTERQDTGAELFGASTDPIAATFDVVRQLLETAQRSSGTDLRTPFLRTVAFDAWIGNGDRHLRNWALLVDERKRCRFAPMFDTAGCLGTELQDDHKLLREDVTTAALEVYALGCPSGYGDGIKLPGIKQTAVLEAVRSWPEWGAVCAELVPRFCNASALVDELLSEIPHDWWSAARQQFARRLLAVRAKLLSQEVP